ncbi:segregation and condensation protein A [Catenisphaera adipataccumulans]|uniref:Segregation and condensation protein A n=1 Tax=Catenisphaera adipataccumulans TaxID=700500 RepID=A0A7W8CX91_9FIRM|nr:segregation/condensation protein A [Catenisphaera adipataccumulans]MBB5183283.1 segregation and condensation protein A [Catenisphaera adipataccumulans]
MEFNVSIEQFDGPLDLMLHLIKENKLDLMDLNLDVLAEQYIDYIHQMQEMHLEIASEYLTELAGLIEYKSRKLLPREKPELEDEYEEDQREKLVRRLLEYQQFKDASQTLRTQFDRRQKQYTRPQASMVESWMQIKSDGTIEPQSVYELLKAMDRVLKRHAILQPYETKVTIKELSVEERLEQVKARMKNETQAILFETLCEDCTSLHMIIVTFLAVLDLVHQNDLICYMDENEAIWIRKGAAL